MAAAAWFQAAAFYFPFPVGTPAAIFLRAPEPGVNHKMAILKFIFIALEVLLVFNLLIFVHELGHFLAAKWRGLQIDRFAIWFGKPIWKKKINGVEYALGSIPAGGYVALPQMATMEAIEGKSEGSNAPLPPISALDKIIVAVAGPLFSFGLAAVFAVLVWWVGKPVDDMGNSTVIGWVESGGPADRAGLKPGDRITAIDGGPVTQFAPPARDSVMWRIVTSEGTNIAVTFVRDDKEQTVSITPIKPPTKWYERKALRKIMIGPAQDAIIGDVATNSPAALAGLKTKDKIVAIDGVKVTSWNTLDSIEKAMTNGNAKALVLTIRRGNEQFERTLMPESPIRPAKSGPQLGILNWYVDMHPRLVHPTPMDQLTDSAGQIFATVRAVFSPKSEIGVQQLGGPILIFRMYAGLFDSEYGWRRVLWFSVILNVNLALLNMLPFPVLDGGHILLAIIEAVRRRPVSGRILQYIQTGCAMVLIGFMLFVTFFDSGDWVRSLRREHAEQPVFAEPKK